MSRRLMLRNASGGILPSAYQQVEYIQSDGNQFIGNVYTMTSANFRAESKYAIGVIAEVCVIGINNTGVELGVNSRGRPFLWLPNLALDGVSPAMTILEPRVIRWKAYSRSRELSDGIASVADTKSIENMVSGAIIQLLAYGVHHTAKQAGQVYTMKLWDNDLLVRDMLPCYRKADNVIGLYDTVSGTFFTNSGTGTFTKGVDV